MISALVLIVCLILIALFWRLILAGIAMVAAVGIPLMLISVVIVAIGIGGVG